ncbi:MAG: phosphatidylinositol mannoside acyltransferase [Acidimicrobiales bacterium]
MSLRSRALVGVYSGGQQLARILPARSVLRVSRVLGHMAFRVMRSQRTMLTRHMRRAVAPESSAAEIEGLVRAAFVSYVRYYIESFRLTNLSAETIDEGVVVSGGDPVFQALADGRGAVVVLPHLGGWEWAAYWFTRVKGLRITAVVEAIEPPELFEWFRKFRQGIGINVVPLGAGAGNEVIAALARNELVVLLSDRDLQGNGAEVNFFGETTTLPSGGAILALRTGAPLFPLAAYFGAGEQHEILVLDEIDTRREGRLRQDAARITQDVAYALEVLIRRAPDQWHLLQPNWPSDFELLSGE